MANTTNNNTILLFLLIVIGFVIYYICGNSNNNKLIIDDMNSTNTNKYTDSSINNKNNQSSKNNNAISNNNTTISPIPNILNNISKDVLSKDVLSKDVLSKDVLSKDVLLDIDNPLYNISGNIEGDTGAELKDAFAPPLNNCKCSSEIDFNKNNVEKYSIKDYLPDVQNVNKEWFDTDFAQARHELDDGTLINPDRYVIGINTVGQSLKNASYDIRGTVPNPKYSISPWNNSTIEPDYNIKSLA